MSKLSELVEDFTKSHRKKVAIYLVWVFLNFTLLIAFSREVFSRGYHGIYSFWPFGKCIRFEDIPIATSGFMPDPKYHLCFDLKGADEYDITEFIFYTTLPIWVFVVIRLLRKALPKKPDGK